MKPEQLRGFFANDGIPDMGKATKKKLTPEQQDFVDQLCSATPGMVFILTGEGGSGKTECIASLARDTSLKVTYLAPTHQAKSVLSNRLRKSGVKEPVVMTVAAFLKKVPDRNAPPDEDNLLGLKFTENGSVSRIPTRSVLVQDEASMLSVYDLQKLAEAAVTGTLVLSGDFAQLKPVRAQSIFGLMMNAVREHPQAIKFFELSQNLRADSPQLVTYLNRVRATGDFPKDDLPDDGSVELVTDRAEFTRLWIEALKQHGQEKVQRLAYTNKTVDAAAILGREALGYSSRFHEEGEILRVGQPFRFMEWSEAVSQLGRGATKEEILALMDEHTLQTGDKVKILKVSVPFLSSDLHFSWVPGVKVPFRNATVLILTGACEGETTDLKLMEIGACTDTKSSVHALLRGAFKAADAAANDKWKKLTLEEETAVRREMKNHPHLKGRQWWGKLYASVREMIFITGSALSMTTHKAQGTGVEYVFVDSRDMGGDEVKELRYTAASRAIKKVTVLV